ncbi:MAG: NADH-quinone oxidoreductase subunit L, partial [Massilia sp.]
VPGGVAFAVAVFAALLTSFYSWRLMFLTFFGEPRWAGSEHIQHAVHDAHHGHDHGHGAGNAQEAHPEDEHAGYEPDAHGAGAAEVKHGTAGYHPHESPLAMLVPLIVLSVGAIFAGFVFHGWFIEPDAGERFWKGSLAFDEHLMHAMHGVPLWVKLSATVVMLIGLVTAWFAYLKDATAPARFTATFRILYDFLLHKWYFDEVYHRIFVRPAFAFGRFFWRRGDQGTIDRFGPNGMAALVQGGSLAAKRLQSGYLYTYALVMLLGLAAAATWAMTR